MTVIHVAAFLLVVTLLAPASALSMTVALPDFLAAPTLRSVADGDWSAPATWDAGRVPSATDVVLVRHVVRYGATDGVAKTLGLREGGVLRIARDVATRLRVGTVVVLPGGTWDQGRCPDDPVTASSEIVIRDLPLDLVADPEQWSNGLLGAGGSVRVCGISRAPTWVRLAKEPRAGDSVLYLAEPVSRWKVGDVVFLPDTGNELLGSAKTAPKTPVLSEERVVIAVSEGVLGLAAPLLHDHLGARDADGTLRFLPHAANLTRNIVFSSENTRGVRGHMAYIGRSDVDIAHAQFRDLGRTRIAGLHSTLVDPHNGAVKELGTNQIGRYACAHFHHLYGPLNLPTDQPQFRFLGNACLRSLRWSVGIHNSHYGELRDNVVVHGQGAGIITEDGGESENLVTRNFVAYMIGSGEPEYGVRRGKVGVDFGHVGTGFWFRGGNNRVLDNVATMASRSGFAVVPWEVPDSQAVPKAFIPGDLWIPLFKGADPHAPGEGRIYRANIEPVLEWRSNESYGRIEDGLQWWAVGMRAGTTYEPEASAGTYADHRVWHAHRAGAFARYVHRLTLSNFVVRCHPAKNATIGIGSKQRMMHLFTAVSPDIQGCALGVEAPELSQSPGATTGDPLRVLGGRLVNVVNLRVPTMNEGVSLPLNPADTLSARTIIFEGVLTGPYNHRTRPVLVSAIKDIVMRYADPATARLSTNYLQVDRVQIRDAQGVAGAHYDVYYRQQAPDAVVPVSRSFGLGKRIIGAPAAGLTNAQAWAQHRIAIAGAVAPCATTRPEIDGYVCPPTVSPPSPSPFSRSRQASDRTAPTVPLTVAVRMISATEAEVTWASSTDAVGVVSYRIYRGIAGGEAKNIIAVVPAVPGTAQVYRERVACQYCQHFYRISAVDAAGNASGLSLIARVVTPHTIPLRIGDRVKTSEPVPLRVIPTGERVATKPGRATGIIVEGPVLTDTNPVRTWWRVDFDAGLDGWTPDHTLRKVAP